MEEKYPQTYLGQEPRSVVWGIILYYFALRSFLLVWIFFFLHFAPVIFRGTCCFPNVICPDEGKLSPLWVLASRQSGGEICALLFCLALTRSCLPSLQNPHSLARITVRSAIPHPTTLTSRGKRASSDCLGFLAVCVLVAWRRKVLRLFASLAVSWDCVLYYPLSHFHLS